MPLRPLLHSVFFFFNDTATTEIYTLSLHDALPISAKPVLFHEKVSSVKAAPLLPVQHLPHFACQRLRRERLLEDGESPFEHPMAHDGVAPVAREIHDPHRGPLRPQTPRALAAAHLPHAAIR